MPFTMTEEAASKSTAIVVNAGKNTQHRDSNTRINNDFTVRSILEVPYNIAVNFAIYAPVHRVSHTSYSAAETSTLS